MKGVFGVVSLLVVLVVIGVVAVKQLRSVGHVSVEPTGGVNAAAPGGATVPEQAQRLQDKVRSDVLKALEQGAARTDEAQK
jgi:sorbitol-specific phosphotransferase system component IIA